MFRPHQSLTWPTRKIFHNLPRIHYLRIMVQCPPSLSPFSLSISEMVHEIGECTNHTISFMPFSERRVNICLPSQPHPKITRGVVIDTF